MKKKLVLIIALVNILIVSCVILRFSYALWNTTNVQEHENIVNVGCFSLTFTETSDILLENSYPMNDDNGLKQIPYKFSVTNTCSIVSKMSVAINVKNSSTIDSSVVKSAIKASGDLKDTRLLVDYKSGEIASTDTTTIKSFVLLTDSIGVSETKDYEVYLWLDEAASNDLQNKRFDAKVVVVDEANDIYTDSTGAPAPELYTGMIAVSYDESGNTVVADTSKSWYDYEKHEWANAVLVDRANYTELPAGSIIPEDKILQYYVWIPRYRYLLWNAENGTSDPQAINIVFEDNKTPKSNGSKNGQWLTHPAFTFGDTELNGIWVGKFENSTSDPSCQGENSTAGNCNKSTLPVTIKPNQSSWININVSNTFNAIKNTGTTSATIYGLTSNEVDTHMLKNMEWGAVAYLSSSIYGRYVNDTTCVESGCKVWINNVRNNETYFATTTGCSGSEVSAAMIISSTCPSGYDWINNGVNASTTGNQYGIYDMSGGTVEAVMGSMVDISGDFYSQNSEFSSTPDAKYYDSYAYGISNRDYQRGNLGDATRETLESFGSINRGWENVAATFLYSEAYWFYRGCDMSNRTYSGIFAFQHASGRAGAQASRSALVSMY